MIHSIRWLNCPTSAVKLCLVFPSKFNAISKRPLGRITVGFLLPLPVYSPIDEGTRNEGTDSDTGRYNIGPAGILFLPRGGVGVFTLSEEVVHCECHDDKACGIDIGALAASVVIVSSLL